MAKPVKNSLKWLKNENIWGVFPNIELENNSTIFSLNH